MERNSLIDLNGPWTFVSPAKNITCNGEVIEWRYLLNVLRPFQAVIWRPIEAFPSKFKVVGINDIPKGTVINEEIIYSVPKKERISVKEGDMIGWSGYQVMAFNLDSVHDAQIKYIGVIGHPTLEVNLTVEFDATDDRAYSIEAKVQSEGE